VVAQKTRLTYKDIVEMLPTLETEEQINLLEVLSSVLRKSVVHKGKKPSLLELEGLGAEVWSTVNIEQYLSRERDSWN
jgi:hypothetical protein